MSGSEESQPKDYFDQIPIWSEDDASKCFDILTDEISGRVPVTRVESWKDFESMLKTPFFNRPGDQLVYRGHRRFDWSLTPTLGRLSPNGVVSVDLADNQLVKFRKAIRGRVEDRSLLENEDKRTNDDLWSVGQHHGLNTPLLDWTYSPFVSLFFAFAGADDPSERENPYRAIYVLNKSFVGDDEQCPNIRVIEPRKDDHGRLVNQAGLFTIALDVTIESELENRLFDSETGDEALIQVEEKDQPELLANYICKIYVRNEDRDGCLKHLRRMNVHHASLFPDIIGAAEYCNIQTEEDEIERKIQEEKTKADKAKEKDAKQDEVGEVHDVEVKIGAQAVVSIDAEVITSKQREFERILKESADEAYIESGRISVIAKDLLASLPKEMVVDWHKRESVQARMRQVARSTLRKYGYPLLDRNEVVTKLIEWLIENEK